MRTILLMLSICCGVAQETNFGSVAASIARVPDFNWISAGNTNIGGTNYARHWPQPVTNHFIVFVDRTLNTVPFRSETGIINTNSIRLTPLQ